ncbi:cytochrome c biogenesis protein CcsA [Simkania negevensis]|uniref:Cytochrome c biogenesis protein CcsA n=1 Tax=Simkania negevensis TaxID=83561 RepID=A0ABS3ARB1_9BACT|nr:cytochrome c biogenesis protein CcsA [Simkania negevensis]
MRSLRLCVSSRGLVNRCLVNRRLVNRVCLSLFLLLVCWSGTGWCGVEEIPVLYKGRFRPLEAQARIASTTPNQQLHNAPLALPTKRLSSASWLALTAKNMTEANPTPYPDVEWGKIRKAYSSNNMDELATLLVANYANHLAGKPYQYAEGKALYYPTMGQMSAEGFYYKLPLLLIVALLYCLSLLFFAFPKTRRFATLIFLIAFLSHTFYLALRCYILSRPPVSNMFESVLYVPWTAALLALVLRYTFFKSNLLLFCASLANSVIFAILLVTKLYLEMENVQAVLDSQYWLIIHVLMIVGSYGVFLLCGALGHAYLAVRWIKKRHTKACDLLSKAILQTMYIGTALLIPGTILGGVWAAQSWGRFWDWDPKESWAFISSCTYLLFIHAYTFKKISKNTLAIGSIVGLAAITFTWYGVNYILGTGMHSYGFSSGGEGFYYAFLGAEALLIAAAALLRKSPQSQ